VLFACGAWALTAAPARADDAELPQTSRFFETYDRNADGVVTADEFDGSREVFRLLDKDKDGKISPPELGLPAEFRPDPNAKRRRERAARGAKARAGAGRDRAKRFKRALKRMDADKDGAISKSEWKGDPAAFDRFDRNGDGKLDKADLPRLLGEDGDGMMDGPGGPRRGDAQGGMPQQGPRPNKQPRAPESDRPTTPGSGDAPGGADAPGTAEGAPAGKPNAKRQRKAPTPEQIEKRFKGLDKDGDDHLTAQDGVNDRLLARMDTDADGRVSLAEFQAAVKKSLATRRDPARPKQDSARGLRMLRRFDQDRDGKVSRDEFPGSDERFDRMDRNADGFLTKADFEAD